MLTKYRHAYTQNVVKLSSSTLNKRPKACRLRYIVMTVTYVLKGEASK